MDAIEMALAAAMGDPVPSKTHKVQDGMVGLDPDQSKSSAKTGIEVTIDAIPQPSGLGRRDLRSKLLSAVTQAIERVLDEAGVV